MRPGPLPCPEARALRDEAFDRDLLPGEAEALEAHLRACGSCRAEAAAAEEVHRALSSMAAPDPGPGFADRIAAALDRGPSGAAPAPAPPRAWRWAASLAATAAVAAAAVLVLPGPAAAAGLEEFLPAGLGAVLPPVPGEAEALVRRAGSLLTPGAALAAAAAAAALLGFEVAAARRVGGRGRRR